MYTYNVVGVTFYFFERLSEAEAFAAQHPGAMRYGLTVEIKQ